MSISRKNSKNTISGVSEDTGFYVTIESGKNSEKIYKQAKKDGHNPSGFVHHDCVCFCATSQHHAQELAAELEKYGYSVMR